MIQTPLPSVAPRPRIVSLLPSATEIVCALDAAECLVGISHECDFPPAIRDRPVLTRARIDPHATSGEIDAAVRAVLRDALSIYSVDAARLAEVAPEVIITQDLCQVCAVSLDDVRSAVARLAQRKEVAILSLRPTQLADVLDDIVRVGDGIGRAAAGQRLRASLAARIADITARATAAPSRPRVVSLEWLDPLMLGGTWMPELIAGAGGLPVGAAAGEAAPTVTPQRLCDLAPDVVMVKPCGFALDRTLAERALLQERVLAILPRHTRVYVSDGNAFFNRPGPRLVESMEILAACIHPQHFADFAQQHASVITRLQ